MLFNSLEFLVFLPTIFCLYWFVFNQTLYKQNILLLIASYIFYGWWDWRFLSLLIISSIIDYWIGISLSNNPNNFRRKLFLGISISTNLGFLCFFKYYNFFIQSWVDAWLSLGVSFDLPTLNIILPIGISFYTFQTLSYSIDVYRGKLKPTRDLIAFSTFVSFFPQLVAGPIERATNLLPQIQAPRIFSYPQAISGLKLILWGLFKKVAIADSVAPYVSSIFSNYQELPAIVLLLGAFLFAFQIYGDFSGYSDIAIGTARLFGFTLMTNFRFPYFSRDIAEFWRRWHISLSTWFRDYIYIPLGGSRVNRMKALRNIFIIFLLSGFWHGANWTFLGWGFIHASLFIPLFLTNKNRKHTNQIVADQSKFPSARELFGILFTFTLTMLAWIFFRAESISQAVEILAEVINPFNYGNIVGDLLQFRPSEGGFFYFDCIPLIGILLLFEWKLRNLACVSMGITRYYALGILLLLLVFGSFSSPQAFIYFQF